MIIIFIGENRNMQRWKRVTERQAYILSKQANKHIGSEGIFWACGDRNGLEKV